MAFSIEPERSFFDLEFMLNDREPCQIEEGFFLGSNMAANNKTELKKLNVTHVLTVAFEIKPAYRADFTYKVVRVDDTSSTRLDKYFEECIDFIDLARSTGGGVFVHCYAGMSRSVTIVVAYLMKKRGMSLSAALQFVKSKRRQAAPNAGFILQLQRYEKALQEAKDSSESNVGVNAKVTTEAEASELTSSNKGI